MCSLRHRRPAHLGLPVLAVSLIAVAGCSSADDGGSAAVPSSGAAATKLCRKLDRALPREVDGLSRRDPQPASELTAGWGDAVIILRCGVPQPPKMIDPGVAEGRDADAVAGAVNGVDWLMEKRGDGAYRFTTANRKVYVEVTVSAARAAEDTSPILVGLAPAIKKAVPEGIAS
ncbi:DUF3515 domain-containing protein [Streptomyces ipomoeae]|uniref:DUF3515 domain-containing protein n=1 Tax=Streptomyces ipomoeae TaxID=103232 RepID=UPI0011471773|nr:DUF3515 domain-containing protein [Streptomyces ipomoeae]MDX2934227.1 DUF3515 domain-containing protein [Streptomyces ipomoeae]TQE30081.1 DUF3515 domain-containing protein [Streptomyces ipomoeae]